MIECTYENGRKTSLRHITIDGLVVRGNKVLLVKRALHMTSNPGKLVFPGGFMSRDEILNEAVVREVEEETGIKCSVLSLFKITDKPGRKGEDRQNVNFTFLMKPLNVSGHHDEEVSEINWFGLDELPGEDEFGFDHFEIINLYLKHLKSPFNVPIIGEPR